MIRCGDAALIDRIQNRLAKALGTQGRKKALRTYSGAALGSSVGFVRKRNEDCCLVARASYANSSRRNFTVAVVCDGLGGMSQGREAAILAASAFTANLFCAPTGINEESLAKAVAYANSAVYRLLRGDGGTTLSAVIVVHHAGAMLCHVGDSRVYGISYDRDLEQLSRDDTINALVNKNNGKPEALKDSRLLQFVGMGEEMEAQIAPISDHYRFVLLTSDGAHDVPHPVLQRVVSAAAGGSDLIVKLLSLAEILGGRDNASVVLLPMESEVGDGDEISECELFTILPNDTLTMCIEGPNPFEQKVLERIGLDSPWVQPRSPVGDVSLRGGGITSDAELSVENERNARKTEPRKRKRRQVRPKRSTAEGLPLETSDNEVDVQFSLPTGQPGSSKQ